MIADVVAARYASSSAFSFHRHPCVSIISHILTFQSLNCNRLLTMFQCEHDTSTAKQAAGSSASSTHSERRKLSTSNPAKSRKASLKPAVSFLEPPNVHPSSLNLENTFAANTSGFEAPAPFSAEMMAIDPPSLSLEPSFEHEGISEGSFDFNSDFDLSPFLQNNMMEHSSELPNSWPNLFDSPQVNIPHPSNWPTTTHDPGSRYQQTSPIQQTLHVGQSQAATGNDTSPFCSSSESLI